MYELIIKDFSNIKSLINFLKEINKLETLSKNFGIIELSPDIKEVYKIYKKSKKYNINLEIQKAYIIKLKELKIAKKIEIYNEFIILDETIKIDVDKIKASLIYFVKKPIIITSPFIIINNLDDLMKLDIKIYAEIIFHNNRILITPDTLFKKESLFYKLELSSERNILNLMDLISKINHNIVLNPTYEIFKKTYDYVKYFFKETIDDKEVLWMIKTKKINI